VTKSGGGGRICINALQYLCNGRNVPLSNVVCYSWTQVKQYFLTPNLQLLKSKLQLWCSHLRFIYINDRL